MRIETGFPEEQRARVAQLFWDAFSGKLGRVLAPERKALAFIESALDTSHAICALSEQGELLGIAGFKTHRGGLLTAGFRDIAQIYGLLGAAWRSSLLDMLERPLCENQMLLDGLFVATEARGQGVGGALIDAVVALARQNGITEIRLDVVDTNIRARALYERYGFAPTERLELGWLSRVFGFHHATTMCLPVHDAMSGSA